MKYKNFIWPGDFNTGDKIEKNANIKLTSIMQKLILLRLPYMDKVYIAFLFSIL